MMELLNFIASEDMFGHESWLQGECVIDSKEFNATIALFAGSKRAFLLAILPKRRTQFENGLLF